jgi:hypothetical protein
MLVRGVAGDEAEQRGRKTEQRHRLEAVHHFARAFSWWSWSAKRGASILPETMHIGCSLFLYACRHSCDGTSPSPGKLIGSWAAGHLSRLLCPSMIV